MVHMNASFHKEFGYVIPDISGRKNVLQNKFKEVSFLFAWLLTEAKERARRDILPTLQLKIFQCYLRS